MENETDSKTHSYLVPLRLLCPLAPSLDQSGYGFKGGPSRCFSFWQEFQKCYAQAEGPSDCVAQSDDYLECLHHGKEVSIWFVRPGGEVDEVEVKLVQCCGS